MITATLTFIILVQLVFLFLFCCLVCIVEAWQDFDKREHIFLAILLCVAAVLAGILMLPGR